VYEQVAGKYTMRSFVIFTHHEIDTSRAINSRGMKWTGHKLVARMGVEKCVGNYNLKT
jgi:hypothetical protein